MTEYPRDQFDDVPEYDGRKGSHRAVVEVSAPPSGLMWISLAAALALIVGAFSYFILPTLRTSGPGAAGGGGAAASATASPSPSASPSISALASPSAQPTAEPSAEASAEASAEPTPEPTEASESPDVVDLSDPVEVYNASRVNGLAGRTSASLGAAGFNIAGSGNWAGFPVSSSAVYYSMNEATAREIAARLGLPVVYDGRIPGIAVVLTAEYAG